MHKVILGRTKMEVKAIGFGGIPIQTVSKEEAIKVVRRAFELGITFFDTARAYTTSEERIGAALAGKRDQVFIATKTQVREPASIQKELTTSLHNLQTDYIDLYQLHFVSDDKTLAKVLAPGGAVDFLLREKENGTIRHLGVTSHSLEIAIKAVELGIFETVQFPFNYIENGALERLYPAATNTQTGVIVMKPLAGGAINHKSAAIRWVTKHAPGVVIPGVATIEELEANLKAAETEFTETDLVDLEKDRQRLGNSFCRRCRYCMPCPNGIDINFIVCAELFYKRAGWLNLTQKHLDIFTEGLACTQCGECEQKCPYDLPLTEMVEPISRSMLEYIRAHGLQPVD